MTDQDSLDQAEASRFVAEWSAALAREKEMQQKNTFSALLFRVGTNLFALSTKSFREVVEPRPVHTIPHRTNDRFIGIVNIRGNLQLCVNIANVLNLKGSDTSASPSLTTAQRAQPRMMVVEWANQAWAFQVDEILTLQRFSPENVAAWIDEEKSTRGMVEWRGKTFDVLDEDRFFKKMQECL